MCQGMYCIISNKRTAPNKRAPFFMYPVYLVSWLEKIQRVAVSTWLSHGQCVVGVGVNAVCYCYM